MTMASSKHLVAALLLLFLLFIHSTADPYETDLCNFGSDDGDYVMMEKTAKGCHFVGTCSTAADCGRQCAALGRNPNAIKCVTAHAGKRCCCMSSLQ